MKTKIKTNSKKSVKKSMNTKTAALPMPGESKNIPVSEIDFSPLNYRKLISKTDLENFAEELALHGIISPLTVRLLPSGRYELVAGERRLRAATIAKFKEVPVVIKPLTDEQVIEIQLAENLQRENPHPMNEAFGISQMLNTYKTIDDIATRLGKSKGFIYTRIKLLSLIEAIQEMFIADIFSVKEAVDIAALSAESQQHFFESHCADWKEEDQFVMVGLDDFLYQYQNDLRDAPFDTKNKKLLPEVGACTTCAYNSATLRSLFPEMDKEAFCTNPQCYENKCNAHSSILLTAALHQYQPEALVFSGAPDDTMLKTISLYPHGNDLPHYQYQAISVM
ncbi:MAG: ParB/RepB/Spo0J family partition protein, partial [Chitinophagales bacterium]